MSIENLEKNRTYLVQYSDHGLESITILQVSKKAYYIQWNFGMDSSKDWEFIDSFHSKYKIIEDITDTMNSIKIPEAVVCGCCIGSGFIPNLMNTAGRVVCPKCGGTGWVYK
jgi:hypothetical protein